MRRISRSDSSNISFVVLPSGMPKPLNSVLDEPRPGRPRTISDSDVERVITKTLESMPKDATHWSTRSMAKATGMPSNMSTAKAMRTMSIGFRETQRMSLAWLTATSPRNSARTFRHVVISRRKAPTGRLMVTQE